MTTVFTNGCFDFLHVGHVRMLQAARELGDHLIVAINSDASVLANRGRLPVNCAEYRMEVLAALRCVDDVLIFDETTPEDIIQAVAPDVLVKGSDYEPS